MLCHLIRHNKNISFYNGDYKRSLQDFPEMLVYIKNNYRTVTLEEIAEKFHYSVAHISRCFKEFYGRNYTDVIRTIKLEKAYLLIINTDLSITEITEKIGYASSCYLSREFKKNYGVNPSDLRKK